MRHTIFRKILLLFVATSVSAQLPPVILPPGPLKPGQTLVLESPPQGTQRPTLIWNEQEIPFYKSKHHLWRALVRVPLDLEPGESEIAVRMSVGRTSKKVDVPLKIQIIPSGFGFETIIFPEDKAQLLNDPSEGEESKLLRVFLKKFDQDPEQYWDGPFLKPISGKLLSPYGIKREKIGQDDFDFHRGIDLKGPAGQNIQAPAGAQVIMVRNFKFHGNTVLLSHGQGVGSIYIHMDSIAVQEGQMVNAGDVIGKVGMSGLATAPHLHWGVYVHGKAVNPLQWLEQSF